MAYRAGSAFVDIVPDFQTFQEKVKAELSTLDEQFTTAGDSAGGKFGDAFSTRVRASLADLPKATIQADADTTAADAKLDESTKSRTATVNADADTTAAKTKLDELTKSRTVKIQAQLEKGGTLASLVNPIGLGALAGVAAGPQALGATLGIAGIGAAFAAAAADAGAFGVVAKGMFGDVTKAQKALTTAQQQYAKATTDKGRAAALAAEDAATKNLTSSEKDLLTQVTGLESGWKKLQQAEQPVVEGALTPWLQTATDGMRLLSPLIEDGANALQFLGTQADQAIKSPFWDKFSTVLGQTGEDALTAFGDAAGHVADGLAHLFVTFAPDIQQVLPFVDQAAASFDKWATSVSDKGLNDFFAKTFSPANVRQLAADGKNLADFVENIAKASGDMSPLAFAGVSNVLTVLGSLPPGVIEAATGLFLAIKTVGTISKGVSAVSGVISTVKGLFGGAATTAETAAEGTTAGDAGGAAAATAFTTAFSAGLTTSLPTAFVAIGTEVATAADGAGTVWGTAAAATFATAFGTESGTALAGVFTAEDVAGAVEANAAGAALGAAAAAGFGEGIAGAAVSLASALGLESGVIALAAAALAGAALGAAVGLGFTTALGATGAGDAVGKLSSSVQAGAASAGTWLQPAGQQTGQGFVSGLNSQAAAAQAAAAALRNSVTSGTSGSQSWLQPAGQQTGQGFGTGLSGSKSLIDSIAGQLKNWVTAQLPNPLSLLVNAGISVAQGFANGISNGASLVISAAQSIANSVTNIIKSALSIGSPSKVTDQLGQFTGIGFGGGMLKTIPFVESSAGQLAAASVAGLSGLATSQSLSALGSLSVPSIGSPARLPGVGSPLSAQPLQLQLSWAGAQDQVTNALVSGLQVHIQGLNGGDVQGALGSGPVRI